MIKRRLGSALRARVEANQFREIILRAITHNVMIVRLQVFYRAGARGNRVGTLCRAARSRPLSASVHGMAERGPAPDR
jgi:hypothetical protein